MTTTYTTTGDVRGSCGHAHKTIRAAWLCARADGRACKQQGGYSDRYVTRTDGAEWTPDEDNELECCEWGQA